MTPERWQQVKAIFEAAMEQAPDDRATFLDQSCDGDAELRHEVLSLLASHDAAPDFLAAPVSADILPVTEEENVAGRRVGAYRLVREIGQGGMGAVYLAERADGEFEQQVAVKFVRHGYDSRSLRRRFRAERQILARLQHPNIARLVDGGVDEAGRPFLAMEYVEGMRIDRYCDRHRLTTNQRLELFRTVCAAVHYAHQNLIVHRDLKPSNILVTKNGTVKLLDFGIAKLLDNKEDATPIPFDEPLTRTGMRVMTPEYASPEQVRGAGVTTASDVYALGVVLFELLTGQRPYRLRGLTPGELERVICDEEPARPSTAVTRTVESGETQPARPEEISLMRATQPDKLRRLLVGDLDTIVLMALRKDPARRYRSVEHFSEDIRRHLEGLPVTARPDAFTYRAAKFMRRHWVGVAAAGFVFLSLLGGMAATAWQARVAQQQRLKAEQRFADVRDLASSVLFELHDAIADLPGSTAARELLVLRSLEYLDKLAQDAASDTALHLELATAYRRVGDVQGNPTNANLGQTQGALASYRKALVLAQAATEANPDDIRALHTLGLIQQQLGDVQATTGALDAADESLRSAIGIYQTIARDHPENASYQTQQAIALIKLGDLAGNHNFTNRADTLAALASYQTAQLILDSLYAADTSRSNVFRLRGLIHERIGTIYEMLEDIASAEASFRTSLGLRETHAARHADHTNAIRDLAIAYEKMADMATQAGNPREAATRYRRATEIFDNLWKADPKNVQARLSLAISYIHLGDVAGYPDQPNLGNRREALQHYQQAQNFLQTLHDADTSNVRTKFLLAHVRERMARLGG